MASRLTDAASPRITPIRVPVTPIKNPSRTNIIIIESGMAPIDLSTPMAFLFSITTMTIVPIIVNPAEIITRKSIMVMISFSS